MIAFGPLSITLLFGAAQGVVLAILLLNSRNNQVANRFLAGLILAIAMMVVPYIIGFAGFYDAYPWLSFSPFATSMSFGPLLYFYALTLTGGTLPRHAWLHFGPYAAQFLSQALVFPLPLTTKNWWDSVAHAPFIAPAFTIAALVSIAIYGWATWRRYRAYVRFLEDTRSDGVRFDPSWIAHFLLALCAMALVWSGFFLADVIDPQRNYFDRFWLYCGLSLLAAYLGVEGWRNAGLSYPSLQPDQISEAAGRSGAEESGATETKPWRRIAQGLALALEDGELWRDPNITVAALAKALGTNTSYVSRALNEGLGVTFSAFVNQRRVRALQALLDDPAEDRDLLALAFEVGFNSKASFNRAFATFAGVSPSAYRRASHSRSLHAGI
jgi:AraC-like DNA-binding protein